MLPDANVGHAHGRRRDDGPAVNVVEGEVKNKVHGVGGDTFGKGSNINAIVVVGNNPRLPVGGESMPAAGKGSVDARAWTLGVVARAVMEVIAGLTAQAFKDVDFAGSWPVAVGTISPERGPVGDIAIRGRWQVHTGFDETVSERKLAESGDDTTGVRFADAANRSLAILALANGGQV